jgi:hypothetical protein
MILTAQCNDPNCLPMVYTSWPKGTPQPEVVVVFGGKPPVVEDAAPASSAWHEAVYDSMPTALLSCLAALLPEASIVSISRTDRPSGSLNWLGGRGTHVGQVDMCDAEAVAAAVERVTPLCSDKTVAVFMTYAVHKKAVTASRANIAAAENVIAACDTIKAAGASGISIVLTGTDATNSPADPSRMYQLAAGNIHYGLSKIAQAYVLEGWTQVPHSPILNLCRTWPLHRVGLGGRYCVPVAVTAMWAGGGEQGGAGGTCGPHQGHLRCAGGSRTGWVARGAPGGRGVQGASGRPYHRRRRGDGHARRRQRGFDRGSCISNP